MKSESSKPRWIVLAVLLAGVVAGGLWAVSGRLEGTAPEVAVEPPFAAVGIERTFVVRAADPASGLRRLHLVLVQGERRVVLLDERFPAAGFLQGSRQRTARFELTLKPGAHRLVDGEARLTIEADDYAWRRWGHGNRTRLERTVFIDTRPPTVEILTRAHNINQGGAGLALYRVSEPCRRTGVQVADTLYPGQPGLFADETIRASFFALAHDQGPGTPMVVVAEDEAGNRTRRGLRHHIRAKRFARDTIGIGDGFLDTKMPELSPQVPEAAGAAALEQFLAVNRRLRRMNYETLVKRTADSDAKRHWHDSFVRLPRAANRAGFADRRVYRYQGREIDRQVHLGVDLASLAQSPVPAANRGRVVFAGDLGIYGQTVLIDHGLGLFSMYAHLSRMDVAAGEMVAREAILGRTGATGLAGGDHLHFSMLVRHTFVNPVEWWDPHWIRHNVDDKIAAVRGEND